MASDIGSLALGRKNCQAQFFTGVEAKTGVKPRRITSIGLFDPSDLPRRLDAEPGEPATDPLGPEFEAVV